MSAAADESGSVRPERRAGGGRRAAWIVASTTTVVAVVGCIAVAGWQLRSADADQPPGRERVVDDPAEDLIDLVDLAEIQLNSNLQYDRCQMDYAAIASDPSSSRNPLYFC